MIVIVILIYRVVMEHQMLHRDLNIKSEDDGSDGEPKLEIADHQPEPVPSNQDAVESLLLLGRQAVVSPESRQRAASLSSPTPNEVPMLTLSRRHSIEAAAAKVGIHDKGQVVSYYQVID